jgi:hypothetical protein
VFLDSAALNAHPSLSLFSLLEFELQLLKLGLSTAKLTHLSVVVHLLDLVVLELLLVDFLLGDNGIFDLIWYVSSMS